MSPPDAPPAEVEAKVAIRDARHASRVLFALGIPDAAAARFEPVRDVYYDTPTRGLLAAGYGYRVRRLPRGGAEATLKALGSADAQGVTTREEHTVPVPHGRPALRLLPEGPLRTTLETVVGDAPLSVLARVTGARRRFDLTPAPGLRVAVTHDRVRLRAGGRSGAEQEVEVELLEGPKEAFTSWVGEALARARTRPSRASKLERALRRGRVPVPSAARVAAARLALGPETPPGAPASQALARSLGRLALALSRALDAARHGSVDGVHDLRTSSRRLRAVLEAHRAELSGKDRRDLRDALRTLRRAAGPARDLDVLRALLLEARVPAAEAPGLAALRASAAARRGAARRALSAALAEPTIRALPDRVADVAVRSLGRDAAPFAIAGAARLPAALEEALARRASLGARPCEAPPEALHALRIAVKHARYAAEAFAPAFGRPVARFGDALRALQEELGTVQDARMARDALRDLVTSIPADDPRAPTAVPAAASVARGLDRRAKKARGRLDRGVDDALSTRAIRDLFAHLAKRTARGAPAGAG